MIKSLEIRNFQSHKNTLLDFAPGINIIVGQSDSGKSAILRALRWLLWNKPNGESFRSHWPGDTEVHGKMDDESISRVRTNSNNLYYLNDSSFTAFGADVPEEILAAHNLSDVNFQSQLERPFLLDDTPGQVAAYLNSIADLSVIDSSMKNVQKWMNDLKAELKRHQSNKGEYEVRLKAFEHLPEMEKDIVALENLSAKLTAANNWHDYLGELVEKTDQINAQIEQFQPVLALEKQVDTAIDTSEAISSKMEELKSLNRTIASIVWNESKIKKLKALTDLEQPVLVAEQLQQTVKGRTIEYNGLKKIVAEIKSVKWRNKEIELKEMELQQTFDYYMPDVCPLCGQEVPK